MADKGWDQTRTAEEAGLSRVTVWNILNRTVDATDETLERLGNALGTDLPDFIVDEERGGQRSVNEPSGKPYGESDEADAAYLRFTLQMTRELSAAEREGASQQVLLRLVDLAEKVAVPIHGLRAKTFLDAERQRIQRGETLG